MVIHETTKEEIRQTTIDRFWETIPPVWNRIRGHLRAIATEHFDISVEQFHILRQIRKGIVSVSELAEARQISRSAVSQSVEALVEKGLVNRQQNTGDRRFVQLELTPNGNEMLNTIFQENRAWMMEKIASLNPEELNEINQAMELLKTTFDEPSE